jgi:DNA recombination protein RmuC
MFLPTEGLYSEVLRKPDIVEDMQRKYRIVVAGPTTLAAILSSLRMGFHTLAIEKRASEVWQILAAVKTEFGRFGDVLVRVKKQLAAASNTIDETATRTRMMEKKLKDVEHLPAADAAVLLGTGTSAPEIGDGADAGTMPEAEA